MKRTWINRAVTPALAAITSLTLCLAPVAARAAVPSQGVDALRAEQRSVNEVDSLVRQMLDAGDFVPGEAVVCRLKGDAGLAPQSDGPLAGAEELSAVTARQYTEATGEPLVAPSGLAAQAEDEEVQIVLVHADGTSTEELLRELLADPRVLSAEPNYLMGFDEDGSDPADADSAADVDNTSDETPADPADQSRNDVTDMQADSSTSGDEASDDSPAVSTNDASENATSTPLATSADIPSTTAQNASTLPAQTASPYNASPDLTAYQWFSQGAEAATPQNINESNPGVHAPNWNVPGTTNATGVVAILDSGIDYTHPDLANVMYRFTPEQQAELGCGEFGYAPAREDKTDPMDGYGHGTHCAGIVAAEWNDFGVSGIASGIKLIAVSTPISTKASDYSYDSIIKGYDFLIRAAKSGIDIRSVNRSLAMRPATNANDVMIQAAGEMGIVTCIASGNEHRDLESAFDDSTVIQHSPYILRVNAAGMQDYRAPYSNYGTSITDLFAPGTSILSAQPSNDVSMSRYYVEADTDPISVLTDFSETLLDVSPTKYVQIDSVSSGNIGYDGDSSSLKAHIHTEAGSYAKVFVDVPADGLSKDEVQDISVKFNLGENEGRYSDLSIMLKDGSYADERTPGVEEGSDSAPNGWISTYLHFTDPSEMEQDFGYVTDSQGNNCIRLMISFRPYDATYEPDIPIDTDMYIDQIAIGRRDNTGFMPYCYMTGTSMATPIVTGAAAIVSSTVDAEPEERAAQTVRLLKGAVRQTDSYRGFCKQNGQLDLSLLGSASELVPVIESASVSGDTLTVSGAYLSEGGTLLVGGRETEVLSWSDKEVEVRWPKDLASGLIPIVVRTTSGAETCRAFVLQAPEGTPARATLYERDLTPANHRSDGTSTTAVPSSIVMTEDGMLLAVAQDSDDRSYTATRSLLRSDNQGASWISIELPMELKDVSIAVDGSKAYVLGATPASKSFGCDGWELYSLDISSGTFDHLAYVNEGSGLTDSGTLAFVNGRLCFVKSSDDLDESYGKAYIYVALFSDDFQKLGDPIKLDHLYTSNTIKGSPKVATVGNSLYILGVNNRVNDMEFAVDQLMGLLRVDVAADGGITFTDLSDTLAGLKKEIKADEICMAASDEGVFLISGHENMKALLPDGTAQTDTFILKEGASSFEPYAKTLSFAPFTSPVAWCSNGWLYAFAVSNYESTTIFGRATKVAEEKPDEPDTPDQPDTPTKPDQPDTPTKPSESGKQASGSSVAKTSRTTLAKTGDPMAYLMTAATLLAAFGLAGVVLGLRRRNQW